MVLAFYLGTRAANPSARLFDRIVCWWTDGPFSHVELVDSIGYCWSSSYRDKGVRRKLIDLSTGKWVLVPIGGNEDRAVAWFINHLDAEYDLAGLLGFVIPFRTNSRRRWFCSEAIAEALGMPRSWATSPNDLHATLAGKKKD